MVAFALQMVIVGLVTSVPKEILITVNVYLIQQSICHLIAYQTFPAAMEKLFVAIRELPVPEMYVFKRHLRSALIRFSILYVQA